jgi:hypothetical protein
VLAGSAKKPIIRQALGKNLLVHDSAAVVLARLGGGQYALPKVSGPSRPGPFWQQNVLKAIVQPFCRTVARKWTRRKLEPDAR